MAIFCLSGCVSDQTTQLQAVAIDPTERDCLLRAMYFESNRSSYDGLMAVGTVVMNRKESGRFPNTVCGVVGQPRQFAAGALTRKVSTRESAMAEKAADAVMAGQRHPNMDYVMYFHTAGLHFPYTNMHYRLVAGGNAFYERYPRVPKPPAQDTMVASNGAAQQPAGTSAVVASLPPPGVTSVPAITAASSGSSFAAAPPPAAPAPAAQPEPAVPAQTTVVAASTPATPSAGQTTMAYAPSPMQTAAASDQASPLFKSLFATPEERQQQQAVAVAAEPAVAQPAAADAAQAGAPSTPGAAGPLTPSATGDASAPVPR